jgi:hypothetical protein
MQSDISWQIEQNNNDNCNNNTNKYKINIANSKYNSNIFNSQYQQQPKHYLSLARFSLPLRALVLDFSNSAFSRHTFSSSCWGGVKNGSQVAKQH